MTCKLAIGAERLERSEKP